LEIVSSSRVGKSVVDRPLLSDLWRAYVAVLLGILVGLAFGYILRPPHIFLELGALVAGPILFVVLLLNHKRRARGLAAARTLGSLGGWLAFVALYQNEGFSRPIYATQSPGAVLVLFSIVALTLIAAGVTTSAFFWYAAHRDRAQR